MALCHGGGSSAGEVEEPLTEAQLRRFPAVNIEEAPAP